MSFGKRDLVGEFDSEKGNRDDRGQDGDAHQNRSSTTPTKRKPFGSSDDEVEPELEQHERAEPTVSSSLCAVRRILPEFSVGRDVSELGLILRPRNGETCDGEMRIRRVCEDSWAEQVGVQPFDIIIAVNGVRVQWLNAARTLEVFRERPLRLLLEREEESLCKPLAPPRCQATSPREDQPLSPPRCEATSPREETQSIFSWIPGWS